MQYAKEVQFVRNDCAFKQMCRIIDRALRDPRSVDWWTVQKYLSIVWCKDDLTRGSIASSRDLDMAAVASLAVFSSEAVAAAC